MSAESIAIATHQHGISAVSCATCGAPMGADQRYCLECGERRTPLSGFLLGAGPEHAAERRSPPLTPPAPPRGAPAGGWARPNAVAAIAAAGVLMLAMGVGVLIGRSGGAKQGAAPAQVVTVAAAPSTGILAPGAGEAKFSSDWPSGTSGYTVQLQKLPMSGTSPAAVQAAKSAAGRNGAQAVGALESGEFASLAAGSYIVYSGVDRTRAAAEKALAGLKRSFPGASVIRVSSTTAAGAGGAAGKSSSGAGSNINHPAPPSVLEGLKSSKGKSYEEKSKNLPNVVSTG